MLTYDWTKNGGQVTGIEDGHPYSVTSTTLRLNRKGSNTSDEKLIPLGGSLRWYFPEDAAVDLAILPFAPDQVNYDIRAAPRLNGDHTAGN